MHKPLRDHTALCMYEAMKHAEGQLLQAGWEAGAGAHQKMTGSGELQWLRWSPEGWHWRGPTPA